MTNLFQIVFLFQVKLINLMIIFFSISFYFFYFKPCHQKVQALTLRNSTPIFRMSQAFSSGSSKPCHQKFQVLQSESSKPYHYKVFKPCYKEYFKPCDQEVLSLFIRKCMPYYQEILNLIIKRFKLSLNQDIFGQITQLGKLN